MNQLISLTRPSPTPLDVFGVARTSLYIPPLDLALDHLFRCLSPEAILTVMEHIIAEKKIMFHSKNLASLTLCIEAITSLIYPFEWKHPVNPCLPLSQFHIFQSPIPSLDGIHTCFLDKAIKQLKETDAVCFIVDLNHSPDSSSRNLVSRFPPARRAPSTASSKVDMEPDSCRIPESSRSLILAQMHYYYTVPSSVRFMSASSRTASMRIEFVKLWSHLMCGYRNFAIYLPRLLLPITPPLPPITQKDLIEATERLEPTAARSDCPGEIKSFLWRFSTLVQDCIHVPTFKLFTLYLLL
jgi:hypothetical protein